LLNFSKRLLAAAVLPPRVDHPEPADQEPSPAIRNRPSQTVQRARRIKVHIRAGNSSREYTIADGADDSCALELQVIFGQKGDLRTWAPATRLAVWSLALI
jgi:hypothetical protein